MLRTACALAVFCFCLANLALAAPPGEIARFDHNGKIHALSLSKDGQQLLTASADKYAYALDLKSLAPVKKFGPHNTEVTGIAGFKDKNVIVSTLFDKHSLILWDWDKQAVKSELDDTEFDFFGVTIAPSESLLVVSMGTEDARFYSLPPGRMGLDLPDPKRLCKATRFSPDGASMVMSRGSGVCLWALEQRIRPGGEGESDSDATINGIAWLPSSDKFVTAHTDGVLRLWQRKDLTVVGRLPKHGGETLCVAVSASGKQIVAGTSDGGLHLYDVATLKLAKQFPHDKAITAVEFVTNDVVATGTADGAVRLITLTGSTTKPSSPPPFTKGESLAKAPAAEEVKAAIALIKEVFSKDYEAAKRPADRAKLAEKLLGQVAKAEEVERYALLEESLRLSVEAGNVKTALSVAERMAGAFQQPPQFHIEYLGKLIDNVGIPKDQGELAAEALQTAKFACDAEQFDDAEQLGRLALKAATKSRMAASQKSVRDFADRLKQSRERHTAYKDALPTLEKQPKDAAANLAAGRYLCFNRGDWTNGIPHLALSSDASLKPLAEKELKLTSDSPAAAQQAVGDAWLTAAASASAADRPYFTASALYWFKQALPKLSALQKLKAEQDIKKIGSLDVERK